MKYVFLFTIAPCFEIKNIFLRKYKFEVNRQIY